MQSLQSLLRSHQTDYSFFCKNAPCWEREYKLKPITENFFHKGYHKLLMQFALLTCYSMLFPLASLCILIINLWDLRQTAYELLLTHRRPLLINNSGPGFWKILFLITAHIAPYFNITVLLFQSWHFHRTYIRIRKFLYRSGIFEKEYQEMETYLRQTTCFHPYFCNKNIPIQQDELGIRYVILVMVLGVVLDFFLRFIIPATSESLEEKIRKENRIKDKYLIRKGIAN
ncbi:anoctamin-6-like isoform X6 [Danaus plexippus]|uniref:anoctamin-6-like isoform X6 n=1 Tax=Danaus plexippus TaxID=13037 RepID=UPI002AB0BA09|nr:anoctamin-6-like isoform X6 [Danaus plexippus]